MSRSTFEVPVGRSGSIKGASFSRRCGYLAVLTGNGGQLSLRGYEYELGEVILPPHNLMVENFEFRNYLASPDVSDMRTEVMYTRHRPSHVLRWSVDRREEEEPLELIYPGVPVTNLTTSYDGRFLAVGNQAGVIEVWNFDFARPQRIYSCRLASGAPIWSCQFDRSNLRLYTISGAGEILLVKPHQDDVVSLSRHSHRFQPLNVACHPTLPGWVVSGTASWILMLDCPGLTGYGIPIDSLGTLPFQCTVGTNVGGAPCYWLSQLPHSKLRAMDPGPKRVVAVSFLDDGGLAVIGPREVEVWDLNPLTRSCRTKSGRIPVAVGIVGDLVNVAVLED